MAGGKLEVQIGADITDFEKKIKEVEFDIKELSKVKLEKLKVGLDTTEINAQIKDAKNNLNQLRTTVKDTGSQIGGQFTKQVGNGGNTLMQFSRIAQDAPFGIMGIGNNITATAESFSYLKAQTGSTGGALKALASSIAGTGGILLGVSLLTTGLTLLSQSGLTLSDVINKLTGNTDAYADALKEVNKEAYASKGVQEAVTNVNTLTNEIKLAKEGFLDKDKVVEHYNETIGKTTGLVNSIEEAEKSLIKNGDAYIKMTLYKAAATLALESAAKSQLEAERVRIKKLEEFTNAFLDADISQTRSKEQYDQKQRILAKNQKNRQLAEIKQNEDAAKINLSIAKKFQDDAAKIAKGFGFNFFGDNKEGKKTKAVKTFNTPQVSGLKSNLIQAPLFDTNQLAVFNGQVDSIGTKLKSLPGTFATTFGELKAITGTGFTDLELALINFNQNASQLISGAITDTFAGIGEALGNALANGGNVIDSVGSVILEAIGSLLKSLGKSLIALGVGMVAAKLAIKNPYTAIAAGVAMVALGAVFSSQAAKASNNTFGGGGGQASTSSGSGANNSSFSSGSFQSASGGGTVVFEIAGQKLIGVLNNTLNGNKRLGGAVGLG